MLHLGERVGELLARADEVAILLFHRGLGGGDILEALLKGRMLAGDRLQLLLRRHQGEAVGLELPLRVLEPRLRVDQMRLCFGEGCGEALVLLQGFAVLRLERGARCLGGGGAILRRLELALRILERGAQHRVRRGFRLELRLQLGLFRRQRLSRRGLGLLPRTVGALGRQPRHRLDGGLDDLLVVGLLEAGFDGRNLAVERGADGGDFLAGALRHLARQRLYGRVEVDGFLVDVHWGRALLRRAIVVPRPSRHHCGTIVQQR